MKGETATKEIKFRFTPDEYQQLKDAAGDSKTSMNKLVRTIVRAAVNGDKRLDVDDIRQLEELRIDMRALKRDMNRIGTLLNEIARMTCYVPRQADLTQALKDLNANQARITEMLIEMDQEI